MITQSLSMDRQKFLMLGDISALFLNSKYHQRFRVSDMWQVIEMPLKLNQYRVYYNQKSLPIAFISWAKFSDEISKKYEKGDYVIQENDWNSGQNLWLIDFISPFGKTKNVFDDLYKNIFKEETSAKFVRRNFNGSVKKVVTLSRNTSTI